MPPLQLSREVIPRMFRKDPGHLQSKGRETLNVKCVEKGDTQQGGGG